MRIFEELTWWMDHSRWMDAVDPLVSNAEISPVCMLEDTDDITYLRHVMEYDGTEDQGKKEEHTKMPESTNYILLSRLCSQFLVPEAKAIFGHENGLKVLKLHLSSKNFLDVEELMLIQSPPNELEHIELKVIDICGLSVYEAVVDVVLWCCCPRSLKLIAMFQSINAEERQVVKLL
nr:hypothetical protein [Tanacetum cinerariifolium]